MNQKGKKILRCFVFLLGLFCMLLLLSRLFLPKNNRKEFGMRDVKANGILGEPDNTVEVLVIGDSEAYSAVAPMYLWEHYGIPAYNCSTKAQQLCYTVSLLQQAFDTQKPKVVLLETNAIYRKITGMELMLNVSRETLPVFYFHDRWKSLNVNDFSGRVEYTWTDDSKGYLYNTKICPANTRGYMKPNNAAQEIAWLNRQYVLRVAEICRENGAELVLFSVPSTKCWNYKRHNGIQELADEMQVPYVDMNLLTEEVPIDWSKDTRDYGDHMNYNGAKKVTGYLGKYLSETYPLSDYRTAEAYVKWNDCLARWKKKTEK